MRIDWFGFFRINDGNSRVNRNAVLGLHLAGLDVTAVESFNMPQRKDIYLNTELNFLLSKPRSYEFVIKSSQFTDKQYIDFTGQRMAGYMMWEAFYLPKD